MNVIENTEVGRSMDQDMQACIEACMQCHAVCVQTIRYSLQASEHARSNRMTEAGHMRLLLDCAAMCQTSADFMLRGSEFHPQVCGVCATVCGQCADSCDRFGEDAQLSACANACRQCASSCQRMSTAA